MHRTLLAAIMAAGLSPLTAAAVTENHFVIRTTQDLIDLCTAKPDDPLYTAAVNFCHGYLVGAYHYYQASVSGPERKPFVCPPTPPPSRNAAIAEFIQWAQAHPQYKDTPAVESEFRFLVEKWPCPETPKASKAK